MTNEWWELIFDDSFAEILFENISDTTTRRDVDIILKKSKIKAGARILDVACGRGRHSIELAKRGYKVVGIDISNSYLKTARISARKYVPYNLPHYFKCDMRQLSQKLKNETFDLVILLFNSFGYFNNRWDDIKVLREVSLMLNPGGTFILNTLNFSGVKRQILNTSKDSCHSTILNWKESSQMRFFDSTYVDLKTRKIFVEKWILDLASKTASRFCFEQNVYSKNELSKMLLREKLVPQTIWGDRGARYTSKSWHQTILSKKSSRISRHL